MRTHHYVAGFSLVCLCCEAEPTTWSERKSPRLEELSPFSPIRIFRPNNRLEIAFDVRTRVAIYVLESFGNRVDGTPTCDKQEVSDLRRRRHRFYEEKSLPEIFRSRNGHYHKSGFDRGHLAPAADFDDDDSRHDTYNLVNIAPQRAAMNRKIWHTLERWTRRVVACNQNTVVLTGPLWLPSKQVDEKLFEYRYSAIGNPPSLISVPTHYFKVVVVLSDDNAQIQKFACFVVPNVDEHKDWQLQDYVVRPSDVEAVSGLTLFPTLMSVEWKEFADAETERFLHSRKKPQGHGPQLPLLQDGNTAASPGKSAWKRLGKGSTIDAKHLCHGGQCNHPYNTIKGKA